jgi:hypothetical protein
MGVRVQCRNEVKSSQWVSKTSLQPKKARKVCSHVKVR